MRHWGKAREPPGGSESHEPSGLRTQGDDIHGGITMAKRGRKKRDRKHSKANHGNRPNA